MRLQTKTNIGIRTSVLMLGTILFASSLFKTGSLVFLVSQVPGLCLTQLRTMFKFKVLTACFSALG